MDWSSGKWVPGPNVFFVVCCNFLSISLWIFLIILFLSFLAFLIISGSLIESILFLIFFCSSESFFISGLPLLWWCFLGGAFLLQLLCMRRRCCPNVFVDVFRQHFLACFLHSTSSVGFEFLLLCLLRLCRSFCGCPQLVGWLVLEVEYLYSAYSKV